MDGSRPSMFARVAAKTAGVKNRIILPSISGRFTSAVKSARAKIKTKYAKK